MITPERYDEIFKKAKEFDDLDNKISDKVAELFSLWASSSYAPIIESYLCAFMEGLECKAMKKHLEYYFFEVNGQEGFTCSIGDSNYDPLNYESYKAFYFDLPRDSVK